MNAEERRAQLLAKAKEAEEHATQAKDRSVKEAWLRIAVNYRDLARLTVQ